MSARNANPTDRLPPCRRGALAMLLGILLVQAAALGHIAGHGQDTAVEHCAVCVQLDHTHALFTDAAPVEPPVVARSPAARDDALPPVAGIRPAHRPRGPPLLRT